MKILLLSATCISIWASALAESDKSPETYDPCCSFPCQNFGVCDRIGLTNSYTCDCYDTGYYGKNCETATWGQWFENIFRPSPFTLQRLLTNGKFFWNIVNRIKWLHSYIMKAVLDIRAFFPTWPEAFNTATGYVTWDGYANKTYYGLTLPSMPKNCPRPMGVVGPKELPPIKDLVRKVFTRTEFKPCPRGTAVLLPLYGQHFTHQGFKSYRHDRTLTWGSHTIDLSHLYGETLEKQRLLRTMKSGKMKMKSIKGEEYPPNLDECPGLDITYPDHVPDSERFCLGHPFFAMLPSLMYWSTLWLREHNRICGILEKEHPDWDDERLFQTTRLIILGETMKVTVEDYVQHISGMHFQLTFEPDLLHNTPMRWGSSRIHVEFNTLYHWHNTMPDDFYIGGKKYPIRETFYNVKPLIDHGMANFTISLSNQVAGRGAGGRNLSPSLLYVAEQTLEFNRKIGLQPFNRYREYFRLPAFKSFEELTGETKLAKVLSDFYDGDIDAVEYFIGMMVEKRFRAKMWGLTLIEAIGYYALRSVYSNIIGSPHYWKESTFGGKVGFDIIKGTTIRKLACRNIKGCPAIQFQIPDMVTEDTDKGMVYNDIDAECSPERQGKTEL